MIFRKYKNVWQFCLKNNYGQYKNEINLHYGQVNYLSKSIIESSICL